jgi:hypothetical protein
MTEHDAFQEARRIVGETGQTLFVFYTKHHHRSPDRVIKGVTRQYDVGLAVPPHGVQVGERVRPYCTALIAEAGDKPGRVTELIFPQKCTSYRDPGMKD